MVILGLGTLLLATVSCTITTCGIDEIAFDVTNFVAQENLRTIWKFHYFNAKTHWNFDQKYKFV